MHIIEHRLDDTFYSLVGPSRTKTKIGRRRKTTASAVVSTMTISTTAPTRAAISTRAGPSRFTTATGVASDVLYARILQVIESGFAPNIPDGCSAATIAPLPSLSSTSSGASGA